MVVGDSNAISLWWGDSNALSLWRGTWQILELAIHLLGYIVLKLYQMESLGAGCTCLEMCMARMLWRGGGRWCSYGEGVSSRSGGRTPYVPSAIRALHTPTYRLILYYPPSNPVCIYRKDTDWSMPPEGSNLRPMALFIYLFHIYSFFNTCN